MTHDFRAIGKKLSNWGRWGKDDERGTTNLITPERIAAGAKLAKTGKVFDLGIPFDQNGPEITMQIALQRPAFRARKRPRR
mgnify:CR=1 FL=1